MEAILSSLCHSPLANRMTSAPTESHKWYINEVNTTIIEKKIACDYLLRMKIMTVGIPFKFVNAVIRAIIVISYIL